MHPVLIVTRPAPDGARFAAQFADVTAILAPLQRIDPVDADCTAQGVIFTSTNGVAQAHRLGLSSGLAWCVGDRTAQMAKDAGFDAKSANGTVEDLLKLIIAEAPQIPLAHIRGRDARGDLAPRLRAAGFDCVDCIAYVQTPVDLPQNAKELIEGAGRVIIPLFSPRAAALLLSQVKIGPQVQLIAISQTVADVLAPHHVRVAISPNGVAMFDAALAALNGA